MATERAIDNLTESLQHQLDEMVKSYSSVGMLLDTETTGTDDDRKIAQIAYKTKGASEATSKYIYYGKGDSNNSNPTLDVLIESMNLVDASGAELIESAQQIRNTLQLKAERDAEGKIKKITKEILQENKAAMASLERILSQKGSFSERLSATPVQIINDLYKQYKQLGADANKLAAHNASFDKKSIDNMLKYYEQIQGKRYEKAHKQLEEMFGQRGENMVDTFQLLAKPLQGTLYEKSGKKDNWETSGSAGRMRLEDFSKLLGLDVSGEHNALTDINLLEDVMDVFTTKEGFGTLMSFASALRKKAEKTILDGKALIGKGANAAQSDMYKAFIKEAFDAVAPIIAQRIKDGKVVSQKFIKNSVASFEFSHTKPIAAPVSQPSNSKPQFKKASINFANEIYGQLNERGKKAVTGSASTIATLERNGIKKATAQLLSQNKGEFVPQGDSSGYSFDKGSLGYLFSSLHEKVSEADGDLSYTVNGDTITFWVSPKGEKFNKETALKFEVGLADAQGRIRSGGLSVQNLAVPYLREGNISFGSIQEKQLVNVINTIDKVIQDGERIKDLQERNPRVLQRSSRRALTDASSSSVASMQKEMEEMILGDRGPMQNAVTQSLSYWSSLASQINRRAIAAKNRGIRFGKDGEKIEGLGYAVDKKGNALYSSDLENSDYLRAFMYVVSSYLTGSEEELRENSKEDEIIQTILNTETTLIQALKNLRESGVMAHVEGEKPQAWLKGLLALGGGYDVNPLTGFHNPSDRAPSQVYNVLQRVNQVVNKANKNMFYRENGKRQGIDYTSAAFEQITGARITGEEFTKALKGVSDVKGIKTITKSGMNLEDAVIISESFAKSLQSWQDKFYSLGNDKVNSEFFKQSGVFDRKDIKQILEVLSGNVNEYMLASPIKVTEEMMRNIGNDLEVDVGSVIRGFQSVNGVLKIITSTLQNVTTGSKLLLENGNRVTARVMSDNEYGDLISNLSKQTGKNYAEAKYLIENKDLSAKSMGPAFGGKIREIAKEAGYKNFKDIIKNGKAADEDVKNGLMILQRMFGFDDKNQMIRDRFEYDAINKRYAYEDKRGILQPLFEINEKENKTIETEFIDLWKAIDYIGSKLLGNNYNPNLLAGFVGMGNVYSYENATGLGSEDLIEMEGRVHFDNKARSANLRGLIGMKDSIVGQDKITEEDFNNYIKAEEQRTNAVSKQRLNAINTISSINRAIDLSLRGTTKDTTKDQVVEIIVDGTRIDDEHYKDSTGKKYKLSNKQLLLNEIATPDFQDLAKYGGDSAISENIRLFNQTLEGRIDELRRNKVLSKGKPVQVKIKGANLAIEDDDVENIKVIRDGDFINPRGNIHDVYLPDFGAPVKGENGLYTYSGIGQEATRFLRSLQREENVVKTFGEMINHMHTMATSKDSTLVKDAQSGYLSASSFAKVTPAGPGGNSGEVRIGRDYLKTFLQSEAGSSKKEIAEATKQLLFSYKAQVKDKSINAQEYVKTLEKKDTSIEQLIEMQNTIIDKIIEAVANNKMNLAANVARYPFISGKDIQSAYIKIDESLNGSETIGIPPELAKAMNEDWDGDKSILNILSASRKSASVEEERKRSLIDKQRVELTTKINDLALKIFQEGKKGEVKEETEWEKQVKELAKQKGVSVDVASLAKEVAEPARNWFVANISKGNFGYVGSLSNMNTRIRETLTRSDWDTDTKNIMSAGYADILNSFFQLIEQDAISAKKVFERLNQKGDTVKINELKEIYQDYRRGDLESLLNHALSTGIFEEWMGNYQMSQATARIETLNPEFFQLKGNENLIKDGKISVEAVRQALKALTDGFGGLITDEKTGVRRIDNQRAWKALINGNSSAKTRVKPTPPIEYYEKIIPSKAEAEVLFGIKEMDGFKDNHNREAETIRGIKVKALGDNSASGMGYRFFPPKEEDPNMPEWKKQQIEEQKQQAANLGSFVHKVLELLIKAKTAGEAELQNIKSAKELFDIFGLQGKRNDNELVGLGINAGAFTNGELNTNSRAFKVAESMFNDMLNGEGNLSSLKEGDVAFSEQALGLKFGERAVAGQFDFVKFVKDTNGVMQAVIEDFKISNDDSEQTKATRLFQVGEGAVMFYKRLESELKMSLEERKRRSKEGDLLMDKFGGPEAQKEVENALEALANASLVIKRYDKNSGIIQKTTSNIKELGGIGVVLQMLGEAAGGNAPQDYGQKVLLPAARSAENEYVSASQVDKFGLAQKLYGDAKKQDIEIAKLQYQQIQLEAKGLKDSSEQYAILTERISKLREERQKTAAQLSQIDTSVFSVKQQEELQDISLKSKQEVGKYADKARIIEEKAALDERNKKEAEYIQLITRRIQLQKQLAKYTLDEATATHLMDRSGKKQKGDYEAYLTATRNNKGRVEGELAKVTGAINELENPKEGASLINETTVLAQNQRYAAAMAKIEGDKTQKIKQQNAYYNSQRSILQMIFGTFKQSLNRFFDYSAAYMIINKIKQIVHQVVQYTAELDAKMVNLQIATGSLREEVKGMMKDYNSLAREVGRTTTAVADAANDWLRAGYEGKEATELVRASMYLSTLGMIQASDATSDLISVLKGWKLESEDIIGVVDKLVKVDMNAAVSAGDIAEAMQMVNYSAQQAGLEMDTLIGILTTNQEVTQRSAQVVGNSWKTVLARIQNVKAGKYAANYEDMQEEGYAEEDWAALNDVETVLGTVGIQLRENATQWRNTEEILNEVARKWENFDEVTQSAIANAFAGTRQRENFIATISNWDSVQKYAEMSANAYGTATTKMEAFTSSVEAAKNRITTAVEGWALYFDGSEMMKGFYNLIANLIKNLPLVLALGGLVLVLGNFETVATGLINTFSNLSVKLVDFGNITDTIKMQALGAKTYGGQAISASGEMVQRAGAGYTMRGLESTILARAGITNWGSQYNATKVPPKFQKLIEGDSAAFRNSLRISDFKATMTNALSLTNESQKALRMALSSITSNENFVNRGWVNFTGADLLQNQELYNTNFWSFLAGLGGDDLMKDMLAAGLRIKGGEEGFDNLIKDLTTLGITENNAADAAKFLNKATRLYGDQLNLAGQTLKKTAERTKQTTKGALSVTGGLMGGMAGSYLGGKLFGGTGQLIGGTLMGYMGAQGIGNLQDSMKAFKNRNNNKEGFGFGDKLNLAFAGISVATSIASLVVSAYNGLLEDAQEKAKKAAQKYTSKKDAAINVEQYDELAKGVDNYGKNISLTDEEYQKFLDMSNQLADAFPELIQYTDEAGNKFVGLAGNIGGVTKEVEGLIEASKKQMNLSLINPLYLRTQQKEAKEAKKESQNLINAYNAILYGRSADAYDSGVASQVSTLKNMGFDVQYVGSRQEGYTVSIAEKDKEAVIRVLESMLKISENSIDAVNGGYTDIYNAKILTMMEAEAENSELLRAYNSMSEDTNSLLQRVLGSGAVDINSPTVNDDLKTIINIISGLGGNPSVTNAFNSKESDYIVPYDYQELLEKAIPALQTRYNEIEDEDERKLFVNILKTNGKFRVNENGEVVVNDTIYSSNLKSMAEKLNFGKLSSSTQSSLLGLGQVLTTDEWEVLQRLIDSGMISRKGDKLNLPESDIIKMILEEIGVTDTITGLSQVVQRKGERLESFRDSSTGFRATYFKDSGYLDEYNQLISSTPEQLGEMVSNGNWGLDAAEALKNGVDDLKKETVRTEGEAREALEKMYEGIDKAMVNGLNNSTVDLVKKDLKEHFSDIDFGEDGLINSFSEMKDVIDSLIGSFDKLKEAKEEEASTGELSMQTVMELVAADQDYMSVLDYRINAETGAIESIGLVDDAENVLIQTKAKAAQIAAQEKFYSDLNYVAKLQEALATGDFADAEDDANAAAVVAVQSSAEVANMAIQEANAVQAAAYAHAANALARLGEDSGNLALIGKAKSYIGFSSKSFDKVLNSPGITANTDFLRQENTRKFSKQYAAQQIAAYTGMDFNDMFRYNKDTKQMEVNQAFNLQLSEMLGKAFAGNYEGAFGDGSILGLDVQYMDLMNEIAENPEVLKSSKARKPTKGSGSGGKTPTEKTLEELMEAADGIIDKEWEAMKALERLEAGEARAYTEYFVLKRKSLENKLIGYQDSLAHYQKQFINGEITESELKYHTLEYEKKEIETKKAIRNLDDEEMEDTLKTLGNLKAAQETLVAQHKQLLATADTEEERIEYTKKLNDALKQQQDVMKAIYEFQKGIYEFQLKYESLTPNSKAYNYYMEASANNIRQQMAQTKQRADEAFNRAQEEAIYAMKIPRDSNDNALYSDAQIQTWINSGGAKRAALEDDEYRGYINDYMSLYGQLGDIYMEDFNNKINFIQRQIDKLNDEKPQEWASVWRNGSLSTTAFDRIDTYYEESDRMQNQIIKEVQNVLKHASEMTDEQIQEAVDKWNDALKQIHENAIARLNDIKDYQESTYSALVNEVNRYIKQIEKQKEIVEDAYDKELDKLKDKEDAIERTNKLLSLQNNLQNAQQEKQRVYREGKKLP